MSSSLSNSLDTLFEKFQSTIGKDLKLNFKKMLESSSLDEEERALAALALAEATHFRVLAAAAKSRLSELNFTNEHITEAAESSALMAMLNTYYRFRHLLGDARPDRLGEYGAAGLRMMSLARPVIGKERFEMLAFAVSVINGCGQCIAAHEKTLADSGVSTDKIHDLARLASVVKGIQVLFETKEEK